MMAILGFSPRKDCRYPSRKRWPHKTGMDTAAFATMDPLVSVELRSSMGVVYSYLTDWSMMLP